MSENLDANLLVERLADEADYAIVGTRDSRTRVLNTRRAPYAAICHLVLDLGGGRHSGCTGFLVAPTVVLTAAHCLHNSPRARRGGLLTPRGISVIPGRNGAATPFGRRSARAWYAHRAFVGGRDPRFDVGIIVLAQPFRNLPGLMALQQPTDAELDAIRRNRFLHISGYPGDKPAGTQWEHTESLRRVQGNILRYTVDTCPGHSGSPVWIRDASGRAAVVGIHTGGPTRTLDGRAWGCAPGVPIAPTGSTNRGVRMTGEFVRAVAAARSRAQPAGFTVLQAGN